MSYSIVSNATNGLVTITNPATGAFTYTPNADANGPDSFMFKGNDGTADSNVATVSVDITPVNDSPVAHDGVAFVVAGASASGTLVATDVDSLTLTRAIAQNGAKGVASIINPSTGEFRYTANAGASGTDTFAFKANDGELDSNSATVTVTIQPAGCDPATDITASLRLSSQDTRWDRKTGRFTQRVRIENRTGAAIAGPMSFVLDALTAGTIVVGASGVTACAAPAGSPIITLDLGPDGILSNRDGPGVGLTARRQVLRTRRPRSTAPEQSPGHHTA